MSKESTQVYNGNETKDPKSNLGLKSASVYTGEEIFEGVFFLQNDIADNVSSLSTLKTKINNLPKGQGMKLQMSDMSQYCVNYINAEYPGYFQQFKADITSGDMYVIESSLENAGQMIFQSWLSHPKYSKIIPALIRLENSPDLKHDFENLDLTNEKDIHEFKAKMLMLGVGNGNGTNPNETIFVAVVAVAYAFALAVSIAAAAYSVVTKVAYWDPLSISINPPGQADIDQAIMISELNAYLN